MSQTSEDNELKVQWAQGGSVEISINIENCYADDEDYEQSYTIPTERWLNFGQRSLDKRLQDDFSFWLKQASIRCGEGANLKPFRLNDLSSAVHDFTDRVRYFSQF